MANPRLIQGRRESALRDHLRMVAKRHALNLTDLIEDQMRLTIEELRVTTPKDTGAAAGVEWGKKRNMHKSHPGWGMRIGNEPGDTGWQIMSNNPQHWAITNPMWVPIFVKLITSIQ